MNLSRGSGTHPTEPYPLVPVRQQPLALLKAASLGFTLIELLVVVAIIAILAGLLLPALSRGTMAARATECRGNLHDIGLGLRMYVDEFGSYPVTGGIGVLGRSDEYGWLMMDDWKLILAPYLGVNADGDFLSLTLPLRKLRCPQLVRSGSLQGNGQYAYNASGTAKLWDPADLGLGGYSSGAMQANTESQVQAPADMIAVGDVDVKPDQTMFWTAGHFDVASPQAWFWPGKSHNSQANLVFCDGHVESGRQTNWVTTNALARARWNNDHNPHPETWTR
jgi:prepilin-type N-terminal cleavage/methylation domain-containing protein/prepilin-type processing-associated H-X9-DG protein